MLFDTTVLQSSLAVQVGDSVIKQSSSKGWRVHADVLMEFYFDLEIVS